MASRPFEECLAELPTGIQEADPSSGSSDALEVSTTSSGRLYSDLAQHLRQAPPGTDLRARARAYMAERNEMADTPGQEQQSVVEMVDAFDTGRFRHAANVPSGPGSNW
eukprot:TRINITY_DN19539_c0_g1_i2.p1 TRINITY_DN19539_c0_g1~~TRINITY_DN19539_c0_g1_i2.p1  ORF type:complete len:109 (-),score=21.70 TRINITY_DN19539_c0_g1_i2:571-897(-)